MQSKLNWKKRLERNSSFRDPGREIRLIRVTMNTVHGTERIYNTVELVLFCLNKDGLCLKMWRVRMQWYYSIHLCRFFEPVIIIIKTLYWAPPQNKLCRKHKFKEIYIIGSTQGLFKNNDSGIPILPFHYLHICSPMKMYTMFLNDKNNTDLPNNYKIIKEVIM